MKISKFFLSIIAIIGFAIISNAQVPNYVPSNGLVGWWPFNGNANDESGNGNNGTVNGATLTTDRFGNANQAYSFDGNNSTINCSGPSIPPNNSFTLSIWVNPNSTSGVQEFFHQNVWPAAFYVGMNGNQLRCGDYWQSTGIILNSLSWQHIVIVRNYLNNVEIYSNGSLLASLGSDIIIGGTPLDPLVFGNQYGSSVEYYSGKLDDFGIWNRILTQCEIQDLFNDQLGSLNTTSTQSATALDLYTWSLNNQTYTQSGTYTTTIPNAAGCDSVITLNLTLNFTGISENTEAQISISPNPSSDNVLFKVSEQLLGKNYFIYDNSGRKIMEGMIPEKEMVIKIGAFDDGVYLIKVNNEIQNTIRLIKQ